MKKSLRRRPEACRNDKQQNHNNTTEKNQQEQNAAQRQTELLSNALENAKTNGGLLLNASGKLAPRFYQHETSVSPFNALTLALHSDANNYQTNLYTLFNEAKKRGESVQTGQKGVPFVWYSWNEYQSTSDPDVRISREDYKKLGQEEQNGYKPIREREVRSLFNIEQTTMPMVNKDAFNEAVKQYGNPAMRGDTEKDDKQLRMSVNQFLKSVGANLVPIRKDGTGIAHYDTVKDAVFLPAQKHYASYADYVQDAVRQVVTATGHPQRLSRQGMVMGEGFTPSEDRQQHERLVVELASAVRMNQFGMPASIAKENIALIDDWKQKLQDNPKMLTAIEADVNNALGMIAKAERGEKIQLTPSLVPSEAVTDTVNAKVTMVRDDNDKWAMYLKPEGESGFAVYPDKEDVNRFFVTLKQGNDALAERVRQELAQKYYSLAAAYPEDKKDLFYNDVPKEDIDKIVHVSIFKGKDDTLLCLPTIQDMGKVRPRVITPQQWQRIWIADDSKAYKNALAAKVFADVLHEKQEKQQQADAKQEEERRRNSPEQKEKERQKEKAKEELTKAETKAVAAVVLSPLLKQFNDMKANHPDSLLLFRNGDSYEAYQQDAQKLAPLLNLTLTKNKDMTDENGKAVAVAGFPYNALDTYLPKIVRAGNRVAICDQLNAQKQIVREEVIPQNEENEENQHRGIHRYKSLDLVSCCGFARFPITRTPTQGSPEASYNITPSNYEQIK